MLKVTLELHCNVCGGERFMLPTPKDAEQDIRCAECCAYKCHSDDLEKVMAMTAGRDTRRPVPAGQLAS